MAYDGHVRHVWGGRRIGEDALVRPPGGALHDILFRRLRREGQAEGMPRWVAAVLVFAILAAGLVLAFVFVAVDHCVSDVVGWHVAKKGDRWAALDFAGYFDTNVFFPHLNTLAYSEFMIPQTLLAAPVFPTRWRWNATNALAVRRMRNGRRAPPYFQRADAEDLIAVIFPDQLACQENVAGEREIPSHPLVDQTIHDCIHETMDIDGLVALLGRLEAGEMTIVGRDLAAPSPLAQEILNARPYAFLDDAPAEERRAMAVQSRSFMEPADAAEREDIEGVVVVQGTDVLEPDT